MLGGEREQGEVYEKRVSELRGKREKKESTRITYKKKKGINVQYKGRKKKTKSKEEVHEKSVT